MDISESTILEIWELFGELTPYAKRNDMAIRYLKIFIDQELDLDDLDDIRDQDEHLDHAIKHFESESEDALEEEDSYED
jgi:hypothetical protein